MKYPKYPRTFSIVMVLVVTALIVKFAVIKTKAQSAEAANEKQESAATMSFYGRTATNPVVIERPELQSEGEHGNEGESIAEPDERHDS